LNEQEKAGLALFRGRARCSTCHAGPNFTDEDFHNTGIAWSDGKLADQGAGNGKFKVPTLREVARTAPYMHDGSLATLEDVVDYYDRGGNANPGLDEDFHPLHLSVGEKAALVAFLRSLSGTIREGK
jgi:cytochrome c peroxidase